MKPQSIILEGVTGSKAYGLDTADSDEDIKGIYVAPTSEVLSLSPFQPKETMTTSIPTGFTPRSASTSRWRSSATQPLPSFYGSRATEY